MQIALASLFLIIATWDDQAGLTLLEYGYIASNDELCQIIGWRDADRIALKQQYQIAKAEIASLKNSRMDVQVQIAKRCEQAMRYDKLSASRHAAKGYIVLRGAFSLTQPCLQNEMHLDDSAKRIIGDLVSSHSKDALSAINMKLDQAKAIGMNELNEIIDGCLRDSESELLSKLKAKAPPVYDAYATLVKKSNIDQKNMRTELRRNMLNVLFTDKLRAGKIVYKRKLNFPASHAVISYLSNEIQQTCSEQERDVINECYSKLVTNYTDVMNMYNSIECKTNDEEESAFRFMSKSLHDSFRKHDESLFSKLPNQALRIKQIKLQLSGVSHQFDSDTGLFMDDPLTDEQRKQYARVSMQRLRDLKNSNTDRSRQMFEMHCKINEDVYNAIMTAQQKEIWDKAIGVKLSKEEICELLLKCNKLSVAR